MCVIVCVCKGQNQTKSLKFKHKMKCFTVVVFLQFHSNKESLFYPFPVSFFSFVFFIASNGLFIFRDISSGGFFLELFTILSFSISIEFFRNDNSNRCEHFLCKSFSRKKKKNEKEIVCRNDNETKNGIIFNKKKKKIFR